MFLQSLLQLHEQSASGPTGVGGSSSGSGGRGMTHITQYFAPMDKALAAAAAAGALHRDRCTTCGRSLLPLPSQPSRASSPVPLLPNLCLTCAAAEQQRELFEHQLEQRSRDLKASRLDLVLPLELLI